MQDLVSALLDATSDLRDLRVSFPASWFEIKDRLAGMSENYLTFDRYRQICAYLGEMDSQAQELLADYLHSLGIALNYREDARLRDTHVLNPHWVTEGIYTILNSRLVAEHHGEVTAPDLSRILDAKRYPAERHVFLLDLMRRFELCFPYADEPDKYLVADLLPKQQPPEATDFPVKDSLQFEYRYPVLPEGLLPRFIVRRLLAVIRSDFVAAEKVGISSLTVRAFSMSGMTGGSDLAMTGRERSTGRSKRPTLSCSSSVQLS